VRSARPALPVIILTAMGSEDDRVAGLLLGADDYVTKPFGARELLARVAAVLRRSAERPADVATLTIPGAEVDFDRREAKFDDGTTAALTEREVAVLRLLACNPGRAVSREELLTRVWRINARGIVQTRTVDMTVARLREKLRDDATPPAAILTVRGKGYMIATPAGEA